MYFSIDLTEVVLPHRFLGRHLALNLRQKTGSKRKTEEICVMQGSDQTKVYIMIFFRPEGVPRTKTESGRRTRWPQALTARPGGGPAPCRLVASSRTFRTTSNFCIFSNILKRRKFPTGKVLDSVFLQNHIPLRFWSLKQADKYPLGILLELWY